jgi:enoyl-CoA hydratase/carnithine racemase
VSEEAPATYELRDSVAWLIMDRPDKRNALNAALRSALWDGIRRFNEDDDAAVLVLTGAGSAAFSAGGDLAEMVQTSMAVPPDDYLPQIGRNITVEKPVIAAVNGVAFGGGFMLAQMCDLCVAATNATFGITEARWGRGAPWAAPLAWLVPPRAAMQILLTGEPVTAQRAYELGLVNEVVAPENLRARTAAIAGRIARNAPLTVLAAKAMVLASAGLSLAGGFAEAEQLFAKAYESEDAQEGPRAFRERREPNWQGR